MTYEPRHKGHMQPPQGELPSGLAQKAKGAEGVGGQGWWPSMTMWGVPLARVQDGAGFCDARGQSPSVHRVQALGWLGQVRAAHPACGVTCPAKAPPATAPRARGTRAGTVSPPPLPPLANTVLRGHVRGHCCGCPTRPARGLSTSGRDMSRAACCLYAHSTQARPGCDQPPPTCPPCLHLPARLVFT